MSEALQGKIAWVTGASRGIGRAVSIDLARRGVNVALIARNRAGLEETRWICEEQGHKIRVELFEADLAQTSRLEELFKGICKDFGPPDFLINNDGISERPAADQSEIK